MRSKILIVVSLLITVIMIGIIFIDKKEKITYSKTYGGKIEENIIDDIYISEDNYIGDMEEIVEPYLEENMEDGYFEGEKSSSIYYKKYVVEDAKGAIAISHGFSESLEKYNEIIYYFIKKGYSVFAMEHRGHGLSVNLGKEDKTQIDVEDFDYYVEDFKTFLDEIVMKEKGEEELFLFAHSMGGAIGTLFLERYPNYFDAAVLSSPMLEINTGSTPAPIAKLIANLYDIIGKGDKYVLGQEPFSGEYEFEESGTTSKNRYDYSYNKTKNDERYQKGGASFRWLKESFDATKEALKKENASKIETPILLFQADNDTFVKPNGQAILANEVKNCDVVFLKGSKHDLYRHSDDFLRDYLNNIFKFYENNDK
ncbi:hydrolase of alpha/beta superfamily [Clostridium bornimense]|uniref:Hydrolase of alpha/beta superfamily n=1 Tax=Clostridium bornimense TaxID=1216932 RepID=W6RZI1_9CLOT|nr:hydrolase of alpha/beta superfamily [Clostridium bornimense]